MLTQLQLSVIPRSATGVERQTHKKLPGRHVKSAGELCYRILDGPVRGWFETAGKINGPSGSLHAGPRMQRKVDDLSRRLFRHRAHALMIVI